MKRILTTAAALLLALTSCDPKPIVCTGSTEVTDLIRRLKPISRYPTESKWTHESGISIKFFSNVVKIELELPNDNQLNSLAPSLREAVKQLHEAPAEVRKALEGY